MTPSHFTKNLLLICKPLLLNFKSRIMKKNVFPLGLTLVAFLALSIHGFAQTRQIKADQSKLIWKGYKVTGSHEGNVTIKEGSLDFKDDKLVGGMFVIDMTTINATDLEGEYQQKLNGHLMADDFFGIENYPTATLVIKKAKSDGKNAYKASGDITIKGVTKSVDFDISVYGSKALATLKLDRTEFGLKYGSGSFFDNLGDKTIYDEFDVVADLQF